MNESRPNFNMSVRDLLIEIDTNVRNMKERIEEIKVDKKDLEKRVATLEKIAYGGLAILSALQFYFKYLAK